MPWAHIPIGPSLGPSFLQTSNTILKSSFGAPLVLVGTLLEVQGYMQIPWSTGPMEFSCVKWCSVRDLSSSHIRRGPGIAFANQDPSFSPLLSKMAEEMALALPAEVVDSVDISGLADAWEGTRDVRVLLRESGSVVQSEPGKYHPSDGVNGVGVNFVTLAPIMDKLLLTGFDDDDRPRIGMVTIPALEEQLLICSFNFFML